MHISDLIYFLHKIQQLQGDSQVAITIEDKDYLLIGLYTDKDNKLKLYGTKNE